jgi:hypothetical protein
MGGGVSANPVASKSARQVTLDPEAVMATKRSSMRWTSAMVSVTSSTLG